MTPIQAPTGGRVRWTEISAFGHPLIGAFSGYKSGHELNNQLLRTLLADAEAWEEVTYEDNAQAPISYVQPAQAI